MKEYVEISTVDEVFERIVIHLLTQNKKSENEFGCKYFYCDEGENLQCAIGPLMNSKFYDANQSEDLSISEQLIKETIIKSNPNLSLNYEIISMLEWFQYIHDYLNPEDWYFACYLLWRDMNFLVNYDRAEGKNSSDPNVFAFTFRDDNMAQKKMYGVMAGLIGKVNKKRSLREDLLSLVKSGNTVKNFFADNNIWSDYSEIEYIVDNVKKVVVLQPFRD